MEKKQRYEIVRVGKADAYYGDRALVIGQTGVVKDLHKLRGSSYCSCSFTFDQIPKGLHFKESFFHKIFLKKLPPLNE